MKDLNRSTLLIIIFDLLLALLICACASAGANAGEVMERPDRAVLVCEDGKLELSEHTADMLYERLRKSTYKDGDIRKEDFGVILYRDDKEICRLSPGAEDAVSVAAGGRHSYILDKGLNRYLRQGHMNFLKFLETYQEPAF